MWVVKLGGSLLQSDYLQDWLDILANNPAEKIAIVPGGSIFADHVRTVQTRIGFNDQIAHHMAVLAMEQFAWLCHGLAPDLKPAGNAAELASIHQSGQTAILLPAQFLARQNSLVQNWSMTSDSIAVWFAKNLQADQLILVKSCPLDEKSHSPIELMQAGIVDAMFPEILNGFPGGIRFFSADQAAEFLPCISGASRPLQISSPA